MVMHARKPQRISDGYFEKHQTHPYQNSKYSSSKGSYDGRYNHDRMRDSPNGNSYRSDSPDSQSPRDRNYQSKNSYLQKIREKERENRDYKSREKYSDCARSPKDKRSRESRDSEHRTNHDRSSTEKVILHPIKVGIQNSTARDSSQRKPVHNSCQEKREDRERVARVGDWSEHISSSGKKYYYNCKTEVSQWEKPREWIERERKADRNYGSTSRASHDKHSNSRGTVVSNSRESSTKRQTEKRDMYWGSQQQSSQQCIDGEERSNRKLQVDGDSNSQQTTQDMDISPGDSTPTSEASYGHTPEAGGPVILATSLPRLASQPPAMVPPPQTSIPTCNAPGPPVSLASLPRLLSQISASKTLEQVDQKAVQAIQTAALLLSSRSMEPLKVDTSNTTPLGEGPPTPTHSESQDCLDARKRSKEHQFRAYDSASLVHGPTQIRSAQGDHFLCLSDSPGSHFSAFIIVSSPPSNLSSLTNLGTVGSCSSLHALRPQGTHLTPSLLNHYRDDLVNHVRGWPADALEKQAHKLSEEGHTMGSLQCTRVSAELKTARSIVRLTEIQATLQEQRILFLRQQIATLEQLKSQNSFMSDDS